jgi:type IV pilus assembly protein PilA
MAEPCARSPRSSAGFTLVELMIVVAIIGILAATAIPNFLRFQLKSKSTEAKINLNAIRTIEEAFYAEQGTYVSAAPAPVTIPGSNKAVFVSSDFDALGWRPVGRVFFSYAVALTADGTGYVAEAAADLDEDTVTQNWGYSRPDLAGNPAVALMGCVVAALSPTELGACDPEHGQSIF